MDSETCQRLYDAYYMRVFSYVMTLAGDRHAAEEITQEAFFRAFSKTSSFRNESDEVTWLCAIAKNCFVDETRRRNKTAPIPEDLPAAEAFSETFLAAGDSAEIDVDFRAPVPVSNLLEVVYSKRSRSLLRDTALQPLSDRLIGPEKGAR